MSRLAASIDLAVLLALLAFGVGCGSNLRALKTGVVAGGPMLSFWPPPDATGVWSAPSAQSAQSLADEAFSDRRRSSDRRL